MARFRLQARVIPRTVFACLCAFAALCLVSGPSWALPNLNSPVWPRPLNVGSAIADLDGDQIPDVASGTNLGRTAQGYFYRIDLDLTHNSQVKAFNIYSNEPNGLDVRAIDVDGDHDLDLVITSRILQQPIGIWLNDGEGNFTRGDEDQYAGAFRRTNASLGSTPSPSITVLCREQRQASIVLRGSALENAPDTFSNLSCDSFRFTRSATAFKSARFRAPPII